ncbi:hypothetical protein DSECCO2_431220 [anaerobic digester metagenome]
MMLETPSMSPRAIFGRLLALNPSTTAKSRPLSQSISRASSRPESLAKLTSSVPVIPTTISAPASKCLPVSVSAGFRRCSPMCLTVPTVPNPESCLTRAETRAVFPDFLYPTTETTFIKEPYGFPGISKGRHISAVSFK